MIARTLQTPNYRPRMVIAYTDSAHAALTARHFRRLGWEVHLASSETDAQRLAQLLAPAVVVVDQSKK
jgi:ActR/RegA family two-component response regulator